MVSSEEEEPGCQKTEEEQYIYSNYSEVAGNIWQIFTDSFELRCYKIHESNKQVHDAERNKASASHSSY